MREVIVMAEDGEDNGLEVGTLIRCKDCDHVVSGFFCGEKYFRCDLHRTILGSMEVVVENDYCSRAKRRTNED